MSTLCVRNVPEPLRDNLRRMARASKRTLSAQVVGLLEQAVSQDDLGADQGKLLDRIRQHRIRPRPGTPPVEALIREDRDR
jgi:hypothetical protein